MRGLRGDSFLLRALRGTEWHQFLDYVSPAFLDVVPARTLWSQGREMLANARDADRFAALRRSVESDLRDRGIAVRIRARAGPEEPRAGVPDAAARRARGQRVLELYFAQLYAGDAAILDLRAARFAGPPAAPTWFPRPFWLAWDPAFLDALRALYAGFYRGDDARFEAALGRLGLAGAGDVFRGHFGAGDQRRVRFRTAVFHSTFHEAFVRCRDAGTALHRNFLPLGLYLACLYEHLERLDVELDVRAAFDAAVPAG